MSWHDFVAFLKVSSLLGLVALGAGAVGWVIPGFIDVRIKAPTTFAARDRSHCPISDRLFGKPAKLPRGSVRLWMSPTES